MTSREEFEKWHQEHIGDLLYRTGSGSYTGYLPISANNVYKAWQEASRRKQKVIEAQCDTIDELTDKIADFEEETQEQQKIIDELEAENQNESH